ncbi:MAG: dTMP kinase [Candidatus Diapherotrites archaeon]|nr:dTMP kinase [Candidatus Diapherotrites archaeon]MDN5366630.1 dTMP kinase [Candidatus Diapherotrites archaeon]
MFFVFEGIDGSGKGTQARLLADHLIKKGRRVVLTEEPTKELFTGYFTRILLRSKDTPDPKTVALMMAADRNEHVKKVIEPALRAGEIVISERYFWSSFVYQVLQGVEEGFVHYINRDFPRPDITILVDVPAEVALERVTARAHGNDGLIQQFERLEFLRQVREKYLELAEKEGFIIIDGRGDPEEVHRKVLEKIRDYGL